MAVSQESTSTSMAPASLMGPVAAAGIRLMGEILSYQNNLRNQETELAIAQTKVGADSAEQAASEVRESANKQADCYYLQAGQSLASAACNIVNVGINRASSAQKQDTDDIKSLSSKAQAQEDLLTKAKAVRMKPLSSTTVGQKLDEPPKEPVLKEGATDEELRQHNEAKLKYDTELATYNSKKAAQEKRDQEIKTHAKILNESCEPTPNTADDDAALDLMARTPVKKADGSDSETKELDTFIAKAQDSIDTKRKIISGKESSIQSARMQNKLYTDTVDQTFRSGFDVGQGVVTTDKGKHDAKKQLWEYDGSAASSILQAAHAAMRDCNEAQSKNTSDLTNAIKTVTSSG